MAFLLLLTSFMRAQSFAPVFEWIERFRDSEKVELKMQVNADSFTFLRSQSLEIDKATFTQLLRTADPKPAMQLKIIGEEELVLEYDVNEKLRLERRLKNNQLVGWKRIDFVPVKSYSLKAWAKFLHKAAAHGLMEFRVIEHKGMLFTTITFKQKGPSILKYGKKSLKLTNEFYKYMKIPGDYKTQLYNSDKFVILVHEPHGLRVGQYQMVPGLKALIDSNSNHKFRFLVEGGFKEETKFIPVKPTADILHEDVSRQVQVYGLLENYIIDGPLAYRLLYNPDLPSVAIDDNESINATPKQPHITRTQHQEILRKVYAKLKKIPGEEKKSAMEALTLLIYYTGADIGELKGQQLLNHYSKLNKFYLELSGKLRAFIEQDFSRECSQLDTLAEDYNTLTKVYQLALDRDSAMAVNINDHFRSKYAHCIPVAFIGNFHTQGIIAKLGSGIGHVVIEPRKSTGYSDEERKNFPKALKPSSRLSYLKSLAGLLKLNVAPTKEELKICKLFLEKEAVKIQNLEKGFKVSSPLSLETTFKIKSIIEQNGSFNTVAVGFGGKGGPPQNPIKGSNPFASFNTDPESGNPNLLLFDHEEKNWKQDDRLNYLKMAFIFPVRERYKDETRKGEFHQDENTNRIFCKIFDPETQTFYFYEVDGMDIYQWLAPMHPKEKNDKNPTFIHFRISFLRPLILREKKIHG
ncbi:MAG: hypothetical protein PVH61_13280 [Candidatus Aminicenantes bacterium]|jgi:hypothetical protein